MDKITITILEDGTIKTETDQVSNANHQNAEGFLRDIAKLAGGKVEVRKKAGHAHTHSHNGVEHTH